MNIAHLLTRTGPALLALGLLLVAGSASMAAGAQSEGIASPTPLPESGGENAASGDEIFVTGSRQGADDAIDSFVETLLAETSNGRVARWSDRICLNIEGGSEENSHYFGSRIADVAAELGIEVLNGRRCEPSTYIVFTSAPDRLLERLNEERPAFYGSIIPSQRQEFLSSDAPVRWVSHSELRAATGETPTSFHVNPDPAKAGGVERPVPSMRTASASRLAMGSRMDLRSMLVIVDVSRMTGISYRSLSAYLAMVVLGNLRQDHGDIRQPSILGIFDSERSPGEVANADLSDWDLAYLRSLYQGNWNMTSEQRIRRIQASMARNLDGRSAESATRP